MAAGHSPRAHDHRPRPTSAAPSRSASRSTSASSSSRRSTASSPDSMALLADAGHNLSDVLGLVVAWAGARMALRSPSPRFTYGLKKASILAALINALLLLVAIGAIAAEAVRRLFYPALPDGATVMAVAAVGIVDQRRDRPAVRPRRDARHQHPRRVPAHERRRRGVGRGGRRRLPDPDHRPAMDRPGDEPGHRRGDLLEQHRRCSRNWCGCRSPACRPGSSSTRSRRSWRAARGAGRPRPPRLAVEHDREPR